MTSIFATPLAMTLLTHPFQIALMAATVGGLVHEGIRAADGEHEAVGEKPNIAETGVREAA